MKEKYFIKEIALIKNEDIKNDIIQMLKKVPEYFFHIPASSTGKYHPTFAQNDGGLIRHTKVAMAIANNILSLEMSKDYFNEREKDLILMAILFHDSIKKGNPEQPYTLLEHPLLAAEFVYNNSKLSKEERTLLSNMIKSHMGEWNKNRDGIEVLPKPMTKFEKIVHMCDCLSSKKYLDVKFNDNEIIGI